MTTRAGWQVVLRSTLLWAAGWPLLVAMLWSVSGRLTGYTRVAPGLQGLLGMWVVFAPGAAVVGALGGGLLLWVSRRAQSQVALHRRGLAWGSGLGLLVGLLGVLLLVAMLPHEGTLSWWELVLALLIVPVERPMVLGEYAAVALSGALLGRVVAGWAAQAHQPRDP